MDDSFLDHPTKTNFARLILWLGWVEKVSPIDMMWLQKKLQKARMDSWKKSDAYGDALKYAKKIRSMKEDIETKLKRSKSNRQKKIESMLLHKKTKPPSRKSKKAHSKNPCLGKTRSKCKKPLCKYASGTKRSFCRRA